MKPASNGFGVGPRARAALGVLAAVLVAAGPAPAAHAGGLPPEKPGEERSVDLGDLVQSLRSEDTSTRLRARNELARAVREGELAPHARERLVAELLVLGRERREPYPVWSTPMLALQLLGELEAEEAIPLALERLTDKFPRPIARDRDAAVTVAADTLARIGTPAIPAILDRAETAPDDAWELLRRTLALMDDAQAVDSAVRRRRATAVSPRVQARLDAYLEKRR